MRYFWALAALYPIVTSAANIAVAVGQGGLLNFTPNTVTANAGDVLVLTFSGNHSLTQSTFAAPCTQSGTIDTGFVIATTSTVTKSITVNDTNPLWFYCAQVGHCQAGMVLAVNPTSSQTFAAFQAAAEGASTGTGSSASPTSTTASTSGSSGGYGGSYGGGSTPNPPATGSSSGALRVGATSAAGIFVVSVLASLAL